MRRIGWVLLGFAVLAGLAALALRLLEGPDPLEILARTEVPPAPVRTPEEALAAFRTAPGFEVELVAAEPLVVDPVAMDWDDRGRLYVVEMIGFMRDLEGGGEREPSGRVVLLEDTDGDGRMDRRDVFADGLVLPRAIAVLPDGVLIGAPPDLFLCRDTDDDRVCDERTRLADYGLGRHDPEHLENGLLPGIDGYLYNAKSKRRFRLRGGALEVEPSAFRGQWGIAQDDEGRLYHNHNSAFLYVDLVPGEYAMRQPATASALSRPGLGVHLTEGASVHGIRVAPGLNRAYLAGTLRPDGRQDGPTAVSGLVIQRGDQYGPEWVGDAFVPEPGSNVVAHFAIEGEGFELRAEHRLVPDLDWGEREFLASSDERFRPVDAKVGPDGAIWVIDMYRGLIQHANYVSEHLGRYATEHELVTPGAQGRIWRVVRRDQPITYRPPPLATPEERVAGVDHPNGWVRDRAQRGLVHEPSAAAVAALAVLEGRTRTGKIQALFTLAQLGALGTGTWLGALADGDAAVRRAALRAGEDTLAAGGSPAVIDAMLAALGDADASVRVQALHSLGAVPVARRPLSALLGAGAAGDDLERFAVLSSLAGLEAEALASEIARLGPAEIAPTDALWLGELAGAAFLAARPDPESVAGLLSDVDALAGEGRKLVILAGVDEAQRRPGVGRFELAGPHPVFDARPEERTELAAMRVRVRRTFTWPGDETPGGARPLTAAEAAARERGADLYAASCGSCHGMDGRGQPGLAPPLAGSPWVRDSDGWLARIVLGGLQGPIVVQGELWNLAMPPHGHDPRFDDDTLAGLMTHLRRSWGHAEEPVAPETVARVRAETAGRTALWTADELLGLGIDHRLDRYAGIYRVPVVGIELEVQRRDHGLVMGMKGGGKAEVTELGDGLFSSPEFTIQFEVDASGEISATGVRDGTSFPLVRVE